MSPTLTTRPPMTTAGSTLSRGRRAPAVILATLALLGLSCNSLTTVDAPDVLQTSELHTAAGANVLRVGALNRFYYTIIFYPFGVPGYAGLLTDELVSGGSDGIAEEFDARRLTADAELPYSTLHSVRHGFEDAIALYQQFPQLPRAYMGEVYTMLALDEDYIAELMCSGVPLTQIVNGQPQYGPQLTTAQWYTRALSDADSGVKYAVDTVRFRYLSQVV